MSTNLPTPTALLACPYGLDQIRATFWRHLSICSPRPHPRPALTDRFPGPHRASICTTALLGQIANRDSDDMPQIKGWPVHGCVVFEHLQTSGLQETITSFGGCFSFRSQRTGTKLSAHSWGIAIDLNPETNAQGASGNMHPAVVGAFRDAGFKWGGDWQGRARDPMPFQFCTGY